MSRGLPKFKRPLFLRHVLHSFRFRLTLLFLAILGLILAGFSTFIYTRQKQVLYRETANRLSTQSTQLAAYYNAQLSPFEEGEEHPMRIPLGSMPLLQEGSVLALISQDGKVVYQQGELQTDILTAMFNSWMNKTPTLESQSFTVQEQDRKAGRTAYLYEVSLLQEERQSGYLLLASPVDSRGELPKLAVALIFSSLFLLTLAFAGGYWLADRAMKPVQLIVQTARAIGENDLSQRLNLHQEDELGELADTFDQMLDRLQAAFERQRQFTADASHELRSPLAIIELESNRALEKTRTPKEYEKVLRLIQSENEWMSRLVNQLLLLARMDAGQASMRAERLDLSEVVVDVTERLEPLAQARSVLVKTGSLGECYVQADRTYLAQLLTNLVENAIKYSQGKDAQVLVESTSRVVDDRSWSLVCVSDNGPGIVEEHLPHIFDRFYRSDKVRTRQENDDGTQVSGSGLGLAIANSIALAYGGKIEVQSQSGKGTTFTVWLPGA